MFGIRERFDPASFAVIFLTFILFTVALFVKGFTHDILLEAGVLLVSVKLIMMSSKITDTSETIVEKLSRICAPQGSDHSAKRSVGYQKALHIERISNRFPDQLKENPDYTPVMLAGSGHA